MGYVVQAGSNLKEIHLEAHATHVFTQGLFSGTKVCVCVCVRVFVHFTGKNYRDITLYIINFHFKMNNKNWRDD